MAQTITTDELIKIVQKSELDPTIKNILIRDIRNEGVNEFLLEQVIAYCDNAIESLKGKLNQDQQNPVQ